MDAPTLLVDREDCVYILYSIYISIPDVSPSHSTDSIVFSSHLIVDYVFISHILMSTDVVVYLYFPQLRVDHVDTCQIEQRGILNIYQMDIRRKTW